MAGWAVTVGSTHVTVMLFSVKSVTCTSDGAPSAAVVARCEALAAPTPTTLTAATLNTTSVLDGTGWDGGVPAPEPMTNLGSALPVLMLCVRAPTLYLTM